MTTQYFDATYAGNPPANYERFFVPAIGAPMAKDLIHRAALRPGDRVLDVACGTGVVARLAAQQVGGDGSVAGLDVNPGMLAVARSATPPELSIDWHEAGAEHMPFPDDSFDLVLCQMGLQFMPEKEAALREMRRVLAPGGRLLISVPGPTPRLFAIMGDALARHIGPQPAGFVKLIFSLYDRSEIQALVRGAGFNDVAVEAESQVIPLPAPEKFLWGYVHSTPLAATVTQVEEGRRDALEQEIVSQWQDYVTDRGLELQVRTVVATARK